MTSATVQNLHETFVYFFCWLNINLIYLLQHSHLNPFKNLNVDICLYCISCIHVLPQNSLILLFLIWPGCPNDLHGRWIWPHKRGKQQHILPRQFRNPLLPRSTLHRLLSLPLCLSKIPLFLQINYFRWDKMEEASSDFFRFCSLTVNFRRYVPATQYLSSCFRFNEAHQMIFFTCSECESLGLDKFPTAERLKWHGHAPGIPDWSETSRFVAFTLVILSARYWIEILKSLSKMVWFGIDRSTRWRGNYTSPSMRAMWLWWLRCQSGPATDGSRWWIRGGQRPTTSLPMISLTGKRQSNSMLIFLITIYTPCSAILLLFSHFASTSLRSLLLKTLGIKFSAVLYQQKMVEFLSPIL